MIGTLTAPRSDRVLSRIGAFFTDGRFAVFALAVLLAYQAFLLVMTFAPAGAGALGAFVEDFRIWCFNYDPKTGWMQWTLVWTTISEPLLIEVILLVVWGGTIRGLWRGQRRALLSLAGLGCFLVCALAVSLVGLAKGGEKQTVPTFPAESLRTHLAMPAFSLFNQEGEPVTRAQFKGRVLLVTAVYSSCGTACPMILSEVRHVLDQLTPAERAELAVLAISLNPEQDTGPLRALTLTQYDLEKSQVHFLNGGAAEVNTLLDQLQIARARNPRTGAIEHASVFYLIDRRGQIAYRLSMSERHQAWLVPAVRVLLAERAD
ncbi:MAG: SCO family protein [Verrucomicrobia bacterium]|nr:SCO family protein [Verrucomicrobiota bacterium]